MPKTTVKTEIEVLSVQVTKTFADVVLELVKRNTAYVTRSDFIRSALRDKIKNDAPDLWEKLLRGEYENVHESRKRDS